MSLVISRKIETAIYIVGDTRITDNYGKKLNPTRDDVIKTIILAPGVCVSFAGSKCIADKAFKSLQNYEINVVLVHFLNSHLTSLENDEYGTEYIVATCHPKSEIYEIKDGTVKTVESSWIGDIDAFKLFQSYFLATAAVDLPLIGSANFIIQMLPDHTDGNHQIYSHLLRAMRSTISDSSAPTVGGFVIPVAINKGQFDYLDYSYTMTHQIKFEFVPDGWHQIPFGTAAQGGYSMSFSAGKEIGIENPAIYFLQGKMGIFFHRRDCGLLCSELLTDVLPHQFIERAQTEFGIKIGHMFDNNIALYLNKYELEIDSSFEIEMPRELLFPIIQSKSIESLKIKGANREQSPRDKVADLIKADPTFLNKAGYLLKVAEANLLGNVNSTGWHNIFGLEIRILIKRLTYKKSILPSEYDDVKALIETNICSLDLSDKALLDDGWRPTSLLAEISPFAPNSISVFNIANESIKITEHLTW